MKVYTESPMRRITRFTCCQGCYGLVAQYNSGLVVFLPVKYPLIPHGHHIVEQQARELSLESSATDGGGLLGCTIIPDRDRQTS